MGRKIGILGGTFDPVHLAHLIIAEQAREWLELDKVFFIPAMIPPHKQSRSGASAKDRLEMVELAIAGNPTFEALDIELKRGGVSYTVDTLRTLAEQHPGDEFYLIMGADNLPDLPGWREPEAIIELAKVAVVRRPGSVLPVLSDLSPPFTDEQLRELSDRIIELPLMEISSTDIRKRIASRRSIRYFVPAAVDAFIAAHSLYR